MAEFVKHTSCDSCGSSDGKAIYSDGSWHCWVCKKTQPSEDWLEENQDKKQKGKKLPRKDIMQEEVKSSKAVISEADKTTIKENTAAIGRNFRSIADEIYKYFGVRHSFDEKTGEVTEQYYPVTQASELTGYKVREVPKNFRSIGRTGQDCDLFMQFRFDRGGKYVIITEGEIDSMSAYQMFK